MSETAPREAGYTALKQARRAARQGESAAAERWSKTAERMAAAAERLAALPAPVIDYQEEEKLREELRRRLALYVEAAGEQETWEDERDRRAVETARALREGRALPPPLPPDDAGPHDLDKLAKWTWNITAE